MRVLTVAVTAIALACNVNWNAAPRAASLNERCSEAVKIELIKGQRLKYWQSDHPLAIIEGIFSPKIDVCIATLKDDLQNQWYISDLYGLVLRDKHLLFHCDQDGVDNVILERARAYGGWLMEVPYKEYLDDGAGGLPRTLKTPPRPYSRSDCEKAFNRALRRLMDKAEVRD